MKCFHPVSMTITIGDKEYKHVPVPCGKCEACLARRARDWMIRLKEELKDSSSAYFITLTYNDEHLPREDRYVIDMLTGEEIKFCDVPVHCVRDTQLFFKRLRKHNPDVKIRYFLVSEFGPSTLRPHYHALIFNLPANRANKAYIASKWQCGFVEISPVTDGRVAYVTKYCFGSTNVPYWLPKNFAKMSLKPAIGSRWYETYKKMLETRNPEDITYFINGYRLPVPQYFRRKYKKEHDSYLSDDERIQEHCDAIEDYLDSVWESYQKEAAEVEEQMRYFDETGIWRETPTEYKKRQFKERFYKKYNKNRKL